MNDIFPLSDQANSQEWRKINELSDEFDADHLDPDKWLNTDPLWRGMKPSWFDPSNVSVQDGCLTISGAKKNAPPDLAAQGYGPWSTAAVKSIVSKKYLYCEIRAKAMASALTSSFWFYTRDEVDQQEIDVFELCKPRLELKRFDTNLHRYIMPGYNNDTPSLATWWSDFDMSKEFHVYAVDWTKESVKIYVDGNLIRDASSLYLNKAMHLLFDSEIHLPGCGLPADADLPSTFKIDYVRSWERTCLK